MLSSNFDFKESMLPNHSFPLFSSAADYNIKKQLHNIKYQFPENESQTEEPKMVNDIFNKTLLFDDYYASIFLYSNFEEESNSISLDENNEQNFEIKTENKTFEKIEEFNSSKTNINKDPINMENKISLNETPKEKKRLIFDVLTNNEFLLFTKKSKTNYNIETRFNLFKLIKEETSNKKRRKKRRRENKDNIRKKIKRGFLNGNLIKNLNIKLKSIDSRLFFERFPQNFISDVRKQTNKEILHLSLKEIFERKELYLEEEHSYYYHNLKILRKEEINNNYLMRQILGMKYYQLFEEYLKSDEFIEEINRLKKNGMNDEYIRNYLNISKHFLEFFEN